MLRRPNFGFVRPHSHESIPIGYPVQSAAREKRGIVHKYIKSKYQTNFRVGVGLVHNPPRGAGTGWWFIRAIKRPHQPRRGPASVALAAA